MAARSFIQLATVILIPVVATSWLCRERNIPDRDWNREHDSFRPAAIATEMRRERPEWVLVGNSMLGSRIPDEAKLGEEAGMAAKVIAKGGSQSATWFLILKQIIAASGAKPRWVTVFFRHTDLTWADFRTLGIQAEAIAQMDGPAQPEWREVLGDGARPAFTNRVETALKDLFPSNYLNFEDRRGVQTRSFRLTRFGTRTNSTERRDELNERFSLSHLRHDLRSDTALADAAADGDDQDDASYDLGPKVFDPSPKASFLPHMVALAREKGIRLHFHRVKRKPRGASVQNEWLLHYMADLGQWLARNNCVLTDETSEPALTRDMYADGDHLSSNAAVQDRYRHLFLSRVKPVIGDASVSASE